MVKITILSPEAKGRTVWALKEEIEKLNAKAEIFLLAENDNLITYDFSLETDLIHSRCGIGFYNDKLTLYSWQVMNSLDAKFVNSLETVYLTSDKFKTIRILHKNNILTPKTALIRDYDDAIKFMEKYGLEFPVVIKKSFSKCGVSVFLAKNEEELWRLTKDAIYECKIIQEFINFKNNGYYKDIRVLVVDDEIVGGYSRVSKDFRTNIHLGNNVEKINLNDEVKEIALKCAEISKAKILGVDILPKMGKYYVIELNSAPGTEGFRKLGVNADKKIAELLVREAKK
ncbi:alpha-L-glutamate ligase, RimK family protein [Methanocaldococcus villosus KIN24-T80]|uniref:Coenzyme gamma-F420-2:alpha-L-glutamate ligase n=1 Tax=Methanocaldococcus villosus KIN24-T80 TaxID=1069083 RepID=N6VQT3_9EURY|nr:coenzyme gamma-F420-2:alpha-L-glutamate ligase [Methanocaldococcus villosus]ENN96260.1 alpha-L-glutamate ligase, RimK family protein [Methanocaldococcus villosus KIN24-T80]